MRAHRFFPPVVFPGVVFPRVLVPTVAMVLVAACGAPPPEAEPAAAAQPAASSTPTTVRLLAHDAFAVSSDLLDEFTARTGITIEVVTAGDAGTMTAGAVLAAGAPTADVIFGVDNTLLARAVEAGVFEPYTSPALDQVVPELRADTAGGLVTPIDFGDVCVNIDDSAFAAGPTAPPTSLADLADPRYRDMLVVQDPATSSPGLAFLLATIATFGDGWTDYWASLRDNGVKVAASWTDAYQGDFSGGGGSGDRPLVVSYATSPPAEIVYASDPKPTRPSTSVMTAGCYRQVEYAGILAGTTQPQAAQQVVDWLLSEPVQADVPLSMFVFPARAATPLPEVFERFAARVDAPLQLDAAEVSANLPTWLDAWGSVMNR